MSKSGFNFMVNYIRKYKSDIPEELRNKCMINEDGLTLATYWIKIMEKEINNMIKHGSFDECVPKWMRHDPEIKDKHGWTIAYHWVTIFNCDVPKWMRHEPNLQNSKGKTIGMIYLMNSNTNKRDFPDWMQCDVSIFDEFGNSILDYWLEFNDLDIPEWMGIDKHFVNGNGETVEMSWLIHRKRVPPNKWRQCHEDEHDIIKYDKNIKTKTGFTYKDIYRIIFPDMSDSDFEEEYGDSLYSLENNDNEEEEDLSMYVLHD